MTAAPKSPAWNLRGDFCETCSCFYICSCSTSNFVLPPNKDYCFGALFFHIDRGTFGPTALDDLGVALVVFTPQGPMSTAPWSAGLIVDDRRSFNLAIEGFRVVAFGWSPNQRLSCASSNPAASNRRRTSTPTS